MARSDNIASVYSTADALPDPLPAEPMGSVRAWLDDATARRVTPNPNAIALATIDADGRPSVRMVLCKDIDQDGGSITFFTNFDSRKGRALAANPRAGCVFHWDALEKQVRLEGVVRRATDAESDAYFASRHWQSRIGAWASRQSRPIGSREDLLAQVAEVVIEKNIDLRPLIDAGPDERPVVDIPRPPFWGGFRLWIDRVELWVGGSGRIHDRALWSREFAGGAAEAGVDADAPTISRGWSVTRLQP